MGKRMLHSVLSPLRLKGTSRFDKMEAEAQAVTPPRYLSVMALAALQDE